MDLATRLATHGYGEAAFDLSPAQLLVRSAVMERLHLEQDLRRFESTAWAQASDQNKLDKWIRSKTG